ncbi:MAG: phenylacetate-CoA oxygenase subunit PaaC [Deinococcota bacterium]|nr:phenylacetate-CoA oxygenase subunit PaaC [Deinococcota bacterium]
MTPEAPSPEALSPEHMSPDLKKALRRYLLTVADDEIVIGYRDSEWTGVAPMVEEDLAFSSLAQDELGHARLLYTLVGGLSGEDPDRLALQRDKTGYYHAQVLEMRTAPKYQPDGNHLADGDWTSAIVRRYLYDLFDDLRSESLAASSYAPLAGAVRKVRREERYHLKHGETWWRTLAGNPETRARLEAAVQSLWPGLLGLFEAPAGEGPLLEAGLLEASSDELLERWRARLTPLFGAHGLTVPAGAEAQTGGRRGRHGPDWDELYEDMTMVVRLEPEGRW